MTNHELLHRILSRLDRIERNQAAALAGICSLLSRDATLSPGELQRVVARLKANAESLEGAVAGPSPESNTKPGLEK